VSALRHQEHREWINCPVCKGAGYLPTNTGKQVLDLMRHNFRILEKNAREF